MFSHEQDEQRKESTFRNLIFPQVFEFFQFTVESYRFTDYLHERSIDIKVRDYLKFLSTLCVKIDDLCKISF